MGGGEKDHDGTYIGILQYDAFTLEILMVFCVKTLSKTSKSTHPEAKKCTNFNFFPRDFN
jgi:hypothetical protein